MTTSIKQERTICVLLPNKDQLDITIGVSVYVTLAVLLVFTNGQNSDYHVSIYSLGTLWMHIELRLLCLSTCPSWSPQGKMFLIVWQSFLESKSCTSLASQWWRVSPLTDSSTSQPENVHTRAHSCIVRRLTLTNMQCSYHSSAVNQLVCKQERHVWIMIYGRFLWCYFLVALVYVVLRKMFSAKRKKKVFLPAQSA